MNIPDDKVRVALAAQDRKINELEKYPICENYSRLEIDAEGMRAALTAFLSSVGGEPIGYANSHAVIDRHTKTVLMREHGEFFTVPLYTASALAARVAGGGEEPFAWISVRHLESLVAHKESNRTADLWGSTVQLEPDDAPLYLHPATARAGVDLEQFRPMVEQYKLHAQCRMDEHRKTRIEKADELLALIDQQGADRG